MYIFRGAGYFGSPDLLTTTEENTEMVQQHRSNPEDTFFSAYKFSFLNMTDCHVSINGGDPIFLPAQKGFTMEYFDARLKTFTIAEIGVQYSYVGAY
jgi:hypothetical protein